MQQQVSILQGDALEQLRTLPDESVQMVCTSPPYYGLRDYGTAEWDGGADDCDHVEAINAGANTRLGLAAAAERADGRPRAQENRRDNEPERYGRQFRTDCGKCGATRIDSQIGLESSPAEYIAKLVAVFREVRRVLRKDGTVWLNLGDSYSGPPPGSATRRSSDGLVGRGPSGRVKGDGSNLDAGLKPKNLLGMPWRLAFALQADGWYLRQDIIWHKPNPMPESVTDRCTKAHEYVFLLSKSERYFYDAEAISEPSVDPESHAGYNRNVASDALERSTDKGYDGHRTRMGIKRLKTSGDAYPTRNKRSVWTITTEPYPEAHFATFPTELPRICILAGSKIGDTILDPFAGSGTTLQVALELSRAAIGIELNAEYVQLANKRLNRTTLGLPLEIAA